MMLQPAHPRVLIERPQRPAHRVLRDDRPHPQEPRTDCVSAQRRDVRIAPVPRQHRQEQRPQHVADLRSVRTRITQRTTVDPAPVQPREIQKFRKVRHLPERCGRLTPVPAHLHRPAERLHPQRRQRLLHRSSTALSRLTHLVFPPKQPSLNSLRRLHNGEIANCGF